MKGKVSKTGYKRNSKDVGNSYNIIPSNRISMEDVDFAVLGVDDTGAQQLMFPNQFYTFPGNYVTEFPMPGYHQMPDGSMMSDDEMKRGGQNKRKTSKNIKSSINELFLRNYQVYGPRGRRIYDSNSKHEGGEHMNKFIPMPPHMFGNQNPWMQFGGDVDYEDADYDEFKYGGIHIAKNKKGTFTAAATKHNMGVQEFARHVLANKEKYTSKMVKKANFARNAAGWNKQMGGVVEGDYENNFDNPFFQDGGSFSAWKAQQEKLGYKLVPGAQREYYDPTKYTPSNLMDRTAPWTSIGNAPLQGVYPAQTFQYSAPSTQFNFQQSAPKIDTSTNPYQVVGFDSSGKPSAYYNKLTGQTVPASQVIQERQAQIGPGSFKDGGAFLKSLVKSAYKDVMKRGGESSPQGMTGDEVREGRNNTFKSYLSNNAMRAIALEEIENLQQLHEMSKAKCGGMYQQGGEADDSEAYWNSLEGYNGGAEMGSSAEGLGVAPQFNFNNDIGQEQQPMTSFMSSDQLAGQQSAQPQRSMYDLMSNDIQNASFQQPQQQNDGQNWFQRNRGPVMAEGIIAGLNFGTAALNQRNTRANEKLLNQRMSADNLFIANQFGNANRGSYDTNSGVFRPNQYGFSQNQGNMQYGGESDGEYMSEKEIAALRKKGFIIEYLD